MRGLLFVAAIVSASIAAACTSSSNGIAPPPPQVCTTCVTLSGSLQTVKLPAIDGVAIETVLAGSGVVFVNDSNDPFSPNIAHPKFYVRFTAYNGSATLTDIPGFDLSFAGRVPPGTFWRATLDRGEWTTVGTSGAVKGHVVTLAPARVSPPIHLNTGDAYEIGVYTGGILPPTPSPSPSPSASPSASPSPSPTNEPTPIPTPKPTPSPTPSPTPTPGPLTVTVTCNSAADACANGTMTTAGSVEFTAVGNTATLTPRETPASTYTLQSDTCNKTDDPSAGGNWATFSPTLGSAASAFTVTARNGGGTVANPASCTAVLKDGSGQTVTIDIGVTLSGVGIH